MDLLKAFFFTILSPIIWLGFFAYAFAISSVKLVEAWKRRNTKLIWVYLWIFLLGFYFLFYGPCRP